MWICPWFVWHYKREGVLQRRGLYSGSAGSLRRAVWESGTLSLFFSIQFNLKGSARATVLGFFCLSRLSAGSFLWDLLWNLARPGTSCTWRTLCFSLEPWLPDRKLGLFIVYLFTGSSRSKLLLKESRASELREI